MKSPFLTIFAPIVLLASPLTAQTADQAAAAATASWQEKFSQSQTPASTQVSQALASLDSSQPKAIAGVIEAAAQQWPDQLPSLLQQSSARHPLWAPLMTAAAVGQRPGDAAKLRNAAVAGLGQAAKIQGAGGNQQFIATGKAPVGKEPIGKEPVGKMPVSAVDPNAVLPGSPDGWIDLTPEQYASLVKAVDVATATALRNGPVGNWLWNNLINETLLKKAGRLVLNPLVDFPVRIPSGTVSPVEP